MSVRSYGCLIDERDMLYVLGCFDNVYANIYALFFFFVYLTVYPPHSMDGAEYTWDLGESALKSFMASYSPVPEHLRKLKNVVGEDERSDERIDLSEDTDIAGYEEDPGIEEEGALEPDPSDEVFISKPPSEHAGVLTAGIPRTRRRLIKGGVHVSVQEPVAAISRGTTLDIPVSGAYLFGYKYY